MSIFMMAFITLPRLVLEPYLFGEAVMKHLGLLPMAL